MYVVGTPIGHLGELSARAIAALRAADLIACEDTRETSRLARHLGLTAQLVAVHEHNERSGAERLIAALRDGRRVALVSDAGTPAVSDPGARVVRAVQDAGFRVIPISGPSAAVVALSASGLLDAQFRFAGFLPVKSAARRKVLESLREQDCALVFYEAPHRIVECVDDIAAVIQPERELVIARELTKLFEQIVRLPVSEAAAWLAADPNRQRGEFVLLLAAAQPEEGLDAAARRTLDLLLDELPPSRAVKVAQAITGAPRKLLYDHAIAHGTDAPQDEDAV
ncbi:MAG: 16S rRNA (cytidine(1402)-2'-O)-methyltransferase [Methyloversatilis sp.]|uniref:16S rRNA (cytidine(1402)-2'-O)-methyltransferase n=1 Tax=Methyloversatilis sp. TaxID=2569862 RepID=UPI002732EC13|nr:16S rRNA (cytidine(1402)-2'-O)-methyltransferase [Methyloversatilis sp.]MDP3871928.1 16S rRNA (cytidine(1402)-2'-O)-methyltransferase [Methyloversatilis sp.]